MNIKEMLGALEAQKEEEEAAQKIAQEHAAIIRRLKERAEREERDIVVEIMGGETMTIMPSTGMVRLGDVGGYELLTSTYQEDQIVDLSSRLTSFLMRVKDAQPGEITVKFT